MKILTLIRELQRLRDEEHAATATEYAVMLALIIAVCVGSVTLLGQSLSTSVFGTVSALFGG